MTKNSIPVVNGGANMTKKMEQLRNIVEEIREEKEKRTSINANIQALRERFQALGVHKEAADLAMRIVEWEVDKRQGFDVAYALMREVVGLPVQGDLFAQAEKLASDVEEKKEAAKPTAKEIADRKFEQTTRKSKVVDDEAPAAPKAPDAAGMLEVMEGGKSD